jgi:hypothetical protein
MADDLRERAVREVRRLRDLYDAGRPADLVPALEAFARESTAFLARENDDLRALLADADALARENDDLRALVADACEESRMWAAGVEAGRGEAAALAEAYARVERGDLDASSGSHERVCHSERLEAVEDLAGEIRALGPARPPPRPHALEAEAARLRGALRGLVSAVLNEMTARGLPHEWTPDSALGIARKALGDA